MHSNYIIAAVLGLSLRFTAVIMYTKRGIKDDIQIRYRNSAGSKIEAYK